MIGGEDTLGTLIIISECYDWRGGDTWNIKNNEYLGKRMKD